MRWTVILVVAALIGFVALSTAGPSRGSGEQKTYVVRPGDTLWEIASGRYAGDPREAVWEIEQANGLRGRPLTPGTVLRLP